MKNNNNEPINELQLQLEQEILGALLHPSSKGEFINFFDDLRTEYFVKEEHRIIFEGMLSVYIKHYALDVLELKQELDDKHLLEKAGGAFYVAELVGLACMEVWLPQKTAALIGKAKTRALKTIFSDGIAEIEAKSGTGMEIAGKAQERMFTLTKEQPSGLVNIGDTVDALLERGKLLGDKEVCGYSWGIRRLDFVTSGIEAGKTYVVGATKKSGKSKFVINTLYALHGQKIPTLFLSMEMNGESVVRELISRFAGIDNGAFKKRIEPETERLARAVRNDIGEHIFLDASPNLTLAQVRSRVRLFARRGVKVVFLDYLQRLNFLLQNQRDMNYATIIANAVAQLADIAKESNVALVFLSQLNVKAEGGQADISHLKDSGGIAEGVDCIMILNNQDRIHKNYTQKQNEIWISIEQRSGASGLVKCTVDLAQARYEEKW